MNITDNLHKSSQSNIPKISVVIATYNRCHLICRALTALINQNLSKIFFEIIVINDGSTDDTEKKVRKFIEDNALSNLFFINFSKNRGSSFARNVGIANARADLIAVTDDDCIAPIDWLSQFLQKFEAHPDIVAAGGFKKPYRSNDIRPSPYDLFMFWRRLPYIKEEYKSVEMSPFNNCGDTANVCYKKEAIKKVGGFNNNLRILNDWELKTRLHALGKPLLYYPLLISHESDLTFYKFVKYWLGLGYDSFIISKIHPQVSVFNTSFINFIRRSFYGLLNIVKAPKSEIFKKTTLNITLFIFLEILINACLWLGKYTISQAKKSSS